MTNSTTHTLRKPQGFAGSRAVDVVASNLRHATTWALGFTYPISARRPVDSVS